MPLILGPTGDFPEGKVNDDDEGALVMGMTIMDGVIVLHFGTQISWIGLDVNTARAIAAGLNVKADELEALEKINKGENN